MITGPRPTKLCCPKLCGCKCAMRAGRTIPGREGCGALQRAIEKAHALYRRQKKSRQQARGCGIWPSKAEQTSWNPWSLTYTSVLRSLHAARRINLLAAPCNVCSWRTGKNRLGFNHPSNICSLLSHNPCGAGRSSACRLAQESGDACCGQLFAQGLYQLSPGLTKPGVEEAFCGPTFSTLQTRRSLRV